MKTLKRMYEDLSSRKDFRVVEKSMDGGAGVFVKGRCKGMTVIWSYAGGWEHVSIDGKNRMPTWDEMCELKGMFWCEDECCVQYHPAKKDYVNQIPYCLHIWKPIEEYCGKLPTPPSLYVGLKELREARERRKAKNEHDKRANKRD